VEYWISLTQIVQALVTSSAVVIGGIWAYIKFFHGRIYKPRMELDVECKTYFQKNDLVRLRVKVVLENVGLSRVLIDSKASAIRIHNISEMERTDSISERAVEAKWHRLGTFPLFDEHKWIEPSEVIRDYKMVEYTSTDPVFKIEAIVMTATQQWYGSYISATDSSDEK
jgi:hypothetical protein